MKKIFNILCVFLIIVLVGGFAIHLATPQENNDNSDTEQVVSIDYSELSIICLGDSITYGYSYVGDVNTRLEKPWCDSVGEILGLKNVYNHGVNGSSLCNGENSKAPMCDRSALLEEDADIILLLGGTNDFRLCFEMGTIDSMDAHTIYGALNTIATNLKTKYPNAYILFMTPLPYYVHNTNVNSIGISQKDIVGAVGNVAYKFGFDVLDLHRNNAGFNFLDAWYTANDYMHPSQAYCTEKLAPLIAQFIKDNYKK